MRYFELAFLFLLVLSCLNLYTLKSRKLGILLPFAALVVCLASRLAEGFRSHIVPALILTELLLLYVLLKDPGKKNLREETGGNARGIETNENETFGNSLRRKLRLLGKGAASVLLALVLVLSVALTFLFPVATLPEASGPYRTGTMLLSFKDLSRKETLSPAKEPDRQLFRNIPVQVWYPAEDTGDGKTASWIGREAIALFARYRHLPDLFDQLTLVKTHSWLNASISNREEKYPVILFSGGGAMFNGQNVIQMEELASHGYVVFAVGHPYEDFACIYPDGTIIPYNEKRAADLSADTANALKIARQTVSDENNPEFARTILRNAVLSNSSAREWSADMKFVADMAVKMNSGEFNSDSADSGNKAPVFAGKLDVARMGAFGHSFGGAACGQLCLEDDRIKAFANMDGSPFGDAWGREIRQPFLILTHGGEEKYNIRNGFSAKEDNFLEVRIKGAKHMNYSDINTLLPILGRLTGFLGEIGPDRQVRILNDYLLNFFDRYLKEKPAPLFDSAASRYPEVTVLKH